MRSYELNVKISDVDVTVFMQDGFFGFEGFSNTLHVHHYAEVHFVESGELVITVGGTSHTVRQGETVVIPAGVFHYISSCTDNTRHCAFQISLPVENFRKFTVDKTVLRSMLDEISAVENGGKPLKLSVYLALLCSSFIEKTKIEIHQIQDRKYLIYEFFSLNYDSEISLGDLAQRLNLSPKQTQREVLKYTGNNFRDELCRVRIEAAKQLMLTENITLQECAAKVGYKSYSGFWKAYNMYR